MWVIGTKFAHIYQMSGSKEIYDKPKQIPMIGDVEQVHYTQNEVLIYIDTKENTDSRYRLQVYRMDGELLTEHIFAGSPQLISGQGESYFVIDQEKVVKYRGDKLIWEYPLYETVQAFHEIGSDRYLLIRPMGYTVWKMKQMY